VPRDSQVFDFIETNNIEGIKALFSRKLASPFDRVDASGWTTLHVQLSSIVVGSSFLIELADLK